MHFKWQYAQFKVNQLIFTNFVFINLSFKRIVHLK